MFITHKDLKMIGVLGAGLTGGALALWFALGAAWMPVAVALSVTVLGFLQLEVYRRLQYQALAHHRQAEALINLTSVLPLRLPLPPMRDAVISPECASILVNTVLDRKPRLILEFGSGVSTVLEGYALEKLGGGRILSLDHLGRFADITRDNISRHGLSQRAQVMHAPLTTTPVRGQPWLWYQMPAMTEGTVDLVIVDGPPDDTQDMARYPALPTVYPYLADDAVIVVDDANRDGERRMVERWLAEYPEFEKQSVPTETGTVILRRTRKAMPSVAQAA